MDRKVLEALRDVKDPELGVSIVDLGLVYGVDVDGKNVKVKMALTTPMCPLGGVMLSSVENRLRELGFDPEVELVFDPPWTPERLSPELKKRFKFSRP